MPFSNSPTRQIEAGDTPGFDDDQKSRKMAAQNISKGIACVQILGVVTIATSGNVANNSPFVPVQSKDNSTGAPGDLEIRGVTADQPVALTAASDTVEIFPGDLVQISDTEAGKVEDWNKTANDLRYARYWGKEAGVFSRAGATPFEELLSTGIIPDESLLAGQVGWFKLVEASA